MRKGAVLTCLTLPSCITVNRVKPALLKQEVAISIYSYVRLGDDGRQLSQQQRWQQSLPHVGDEPLDGVRHSSGVSGQHRPLGGVFGVDSQRAGSLDQAGRALQHGLCCRQDGLHGCMTLRTVSGHENDRTRFNLNETGSIQAHTLSSAFPLLTDSMTSMSTEQVSTKQQYSNCPRAIQSFHVRVDS